LALQFTLPLPLALDWGLAICNC